MTDNNQSQKRVFISAGNALVDAAKIIGVGDVMVEFDQATKFVCAGFMTDGGMINTGTSSIPKERLQRAWLAALQCIDESAGDIILVVSRINNDIKSTTKQAFIAGLGE